MASASYTDCSSGASGSGSSAATYAGDPVARTSAVPNSAGSAATTSSGTPSIVTPTARRSARSSSATICGSAAKRSSTGCGSGAAQTTASHSHESRQRRTSPAGSPPSAAATAPTSSRARLSRSPSRGRGCCSLRERLEQQRLGLGTDPRHVAQPPRRGGLAELVGGADVERPRKLDRASSAEPEVPTEADEIGRQLALELGELGDLAGLDQLAEPRRDSVADSAQLADPLGPHEVRDRDRRIADRLGGTPVGADRVRVRLDELEHQRERLEAIGDLGVVHGPVVSRPWPVRG